MRSWALALVLGMVFGCDTGTGVKGTDTDADTDTDTDADTDTDIDIDELLNIGSVGACSNVLYYDEAVVAAMFWGGDWSKTSDTRYEGHEYAVLYANPYWQNGCDGGCSSNPGADCVIVYDSAGDVVPASNNCPLCDYGLDISAIVNRSLTTCPNAMWDPDVPGSDPDFFSWSLQYDIDERTDGTSEVRWTSGTTLGEGTWSANNVTYQADVDCKFF